MMQQRGDPESRYNGPDANGRSPGQRADTAGESATATGARVLEVATQVTEQVRTYASNVGSAARNFKPFTERAMQQRPLGTLAAAALIGFVLGALWKR
jgi:ElaB/YqjD/DUF883 family membrane-anchored ribosome-binding protein